MFLFIFSSVFCFCLEFYSNIWPFSSSSAMKPFEEKRPLLAYHREQELEAKKRTFL